jgi:ABC-type phosphonate transport system ATPase subunit
MCTAVLADLFLNFFAEQNCKKIVLNGRPYQLLNVIGRGGSSKACYLLLLICSVTDNNNINYSIQHRFCHLSLLPRVVLCDCCVAVRFVSLMQL